MTQGRNKGRPPLRKLMIPGVENGPGEEVREMEAPVPSTRGDEAPEKEVEIPSIALEPERIEGVQILLVQRMTAWNAA